MIDIEDPETRRPDLSITPDQAFFILMKAREYDEQTPMIDPDDGSDDAEVGDEPVRQEADEETDDAVEEELVSAIQALNDDAQLDLIALIWIGRGDFSATEWTDAREAARDIGRERAPRYVCGIPLASDYLDDGLAQFGYSLEDYLEV
jgi:hypothetical protein